MISSSGGSATDIHTCAGTQLLIFHSEQVSIDALPSCGNAETKYIHSALCLLCLCLLLLHLLLLHLLHLLLLHLLLLHLLHLHLLLHLLLRLHLLHLLLHLLLLRLRHLCQPQLLASLHLGHHTLPADNKSSIRPSDTLLLPNVLTGCWKNNTRNDQK
jgi:hypothetical protein